MRSKLKCLEEASDARLAETCKASFKSYLTTRRFKKQFYILKIYIHNVLSLKLKKIYRIDKQLFNNFVY